MSKKISIITINYNNLDGLKRTVESVIKQTYKEFEYIIIDGGSTDGSKEYIQAMNKYFDYWVSEPDKGIYNAMNKGIKQAIGEYLMFMNSGDCINDKYVLWDIFGNTNFSQDIIYGDTNYQKNNKELLYNKCSEKLDFDFLIRNDINHQSCFIKKNLFERFGNYDEELKISSDHKFFLLTILLGSATYKYIPRCVAIYDLGGISMKNESLQYSEREKIQKQLIPKIIWSLYEENLLFKTKQASSLPVKLFSKLIMLFKK